jgi:hypothetical protein
MLIIYFYLCSDYTYILIYSVFLYLFNKPVLWYQINKISYGNHRQSYDFNYYSGSYYIHKLHLFTCIIFHTRLFVNKPELGKQEAKGILPNYNNFLPLYQSDLNSSLRKKYKYYYNLQNVL